jgi:hypothetical protein
MKPRSGQRWSSQRASSRNEPPDMRTLTVDDRLGPQSTTLTLVRIKSKKSASVRLGSADLIRGGGDQFEKI